MGEKRATHSSTATMGNATLNGNMMNDEENMGVGFKLVSNCARVETGNVNHPAFSYPLGCKKAAVKHRMKMRLHMTSNLET